MNLLGAGQTADYIDTGSWADKAAKEAKKVGTVNVAASSKAENYSRIPARAELKLTPGAAYVHMTSNNTIEGTEFKDLPDVGAAPLVSDTSSDMFSRPIDVDRHALIYAGAQKNMGPAGVTLVRVRVAEDATLHAVWNLLLGHSRGHYYLLTSETLSVQDAHRLGDFLDAHRIAGRTLDLHLRHARDHGDTLGDRRLGVFVDRRERQRGRVQHEEQHRLIAGVDLLVGRRHGHLRRQLPGGLRDHRLHVLGSRVDVAAQVEQQRDVGAALRAGRVDRLQTRDGRELLLERQSDR